ncbi:MAG: hypothetical protein GY946_16485, partial [bacterium]|nr:hypothetical protein [bacterium]
MRSAAIDAARQEYNGRTINTEQAEAIADGVVGELRGVLTAGSGVNVLGRGDRLEGIELAGSSGGEAKGLDRFHAEVAGNRAAAAALDVLRAAGVDALSETGGPVEAWRLVEAARRDVAEALNDGSAGIMPGDMAESAAAASIKAQVEAYREMENVARTAIRERMRGDIEKHQSLQRRAAETAADAFFEEFERARKRGDAQELAAASAQNRAEAAVRSLAGSSTPPQINRLTLDNTGMGLQEESSQITTAFGTGDYANLMSTAIAGLVGRRPGASRNAAIRVALEAVNFEETDAAGWAAWEERTAAEVEKYVRAAVREATRRAGYIHETAPQLTRHRVTGGVLDYGPVYALAEEIQWILDAALSANEDVERLELSPGPWSSLGLKFDEESVKTNRKIWQVYGKAFRIGGGGTGFGPPIASEISRVIAEAQIAMQKAYALLDSAVAVRDTYQTQIANATAGEVARSEALAEGINELVNVPWGFCGERTREIELLQTTPLSGTDFFNPREPLNASADYHPPTGGGGSGGGGGGCGSGNYVGIYAGAFEYVSGDLPTANFILNTNPTTVDLDIDGVDMEVVLPLPMVSPLMATLALPTFSCTVGA